MDRLKDLAKGFAIGVANVIPGFSGGTMALIFGLYEKIIYAISHFFEEPLAILKTLWAVIVGVILGLISAIFGIVVLLEHYPLPTILFFVGLIIGSLPKISKEANLTSKTLGPKLALFTGVILLLVLTYLEFRVTSLEPGTFFFVLGLLMIGALASSSMVVPGISGSLVLLIFGYYDYILETLSDFTKSILQFDTALLTDTFGIVLMFGIGVLVGIIVIAKVIEKLLLKRKTLVYGFITGLLIASPFAIFEKALPKGISFDRFLINSISLLMLIVGMGIAYFLGTKEQSIEALHASVDE